MNFNDSKERRNVLISILIVGLLFSITTLGSSVKFLFSIPVYIVAVAIALCGNAIISRLTAEKMGGVFIYKFWFPGLILSILSAILTMGSAVFAVPTSKTIEPKRFQRWEKKDVHMSNREMGIISLVGPLSNFILAVIFWGLFELSGLGFLLTFGFVNLWVSLSHLIPYHPLDGARVIVWNDLIWLGSIILPAVGLLLYFF